MKLKSSLINIIGGVFVLNGIIESFFGGWIKNTIHFPSKEILFSIIEIAVGVSLLMRWRVSKITANFSRLAATFYSGFCLLSIFILPFYEEFQYDSVKGLGAFYLFFYLFSFLVLLKAKPEFPTPVILGQYLAIPHQESLKVTASNKKIEMSIQSRLKLLGYILIADSLIHFVLALIIGAEKAPGFIHSDMILAEIIMALTLLFTHSGTRSWVATSSAICFLLFFFIPWVSVLWIFFNVPEAKELADALGFLSWQSYFKAHYVSLIIFNCLYGLFFLYICIFLGRPEVCAYFHEQKSIQQEKKKRAIANEEKN